MFPRVGNHVTKHFGGDGCIDGGDGLCGIRVLHSFNDVVNLHSCFNVGEIEGAIQNGIAVCIVGEGAKDGGNGAGDKGGRGGLSVVFLAFLSKEFAEGLGFENSGPCGIFDVGGVVGDEDAVEAYMFTAFDPGANIS